MPARDHIPVAGWGQAGAGTRGTAGSGTEHPWWHQLQQRRPSRDTQAVKDLGPGTSGIAARTPDAPVSVPVRRTASSLSLHHVQQCGRRCVRPQAGRPRTRGGAWSERGASAPYVHLRCRAPGRIRPVLYVSHESCAGCLRAIAVVCHAVLPKAPQKVSLYEDLAFPVCHEQVQLGVGFRGGTELWGLPLCPLNAGCRWLAQVPRLAGSVLGRTV